MRRAPLIAVTVLATLLLAPSASAVHPRTVDFIAAFEGYYAEPYNDPAGFATVGYGHLIAYRGVKKSDRRLIWVNNQKQPGRLTVGEAKRLLRRDLRKYEAEVFKRIGNTPVNRPMMTALTSFTFNLGPGMLDRYRSPYLKRTTNVAGKLNRGRYFKAAADMRIYDGVVQNGKRIVYAGLTRRRNDEYRLMVRGIRQLEKCGTRCGTSGTEEPADPVDPGNSGGLQPG